jgi:hypothetical protein
VSPWDDAWRDNRKRQRPGKVLNDTISEPRPIPAPWYMRRGECTHPHLVNWGKQRRMVRCPECDRVWEVDP